jgi:hypothetical protein
MYIHVGIVIKTDKGLMEHSFVECDIVEDNVRSTSGNQVVAVDLLLWRKSIYTTTQQSSSSAEQRVSCKVRQG